MASPWMPFYVADYLADTGHLSTEQHGAYLLLICHYWRTGGLPDDDAQLSRITRTTVEKWLDMRPMLVAFFSMPGWHHKRIDEELKRAVSVRKTNQERAAKAAKSRWNKTKPDNARSIRQAVSKNTQSQSQSQLDTSVSNKRARSALVEGYARDFDHWYDGYPHKVGRADAARSYLKARRAGVTHEDLVSGLERYRTSKPPDRPWCNPSTWLNQERWKDQPAEISPKGGANGQGSGDGSARRSVTEVADALTEWVREQERGGLSSFHRH